MNATSYFGPGFFKRGEPEPEYETFEQWCWRWIHSERVALESVRESLRESSAKPAAPEIPAIPDNVAVNSSVAAAWERFHRSPARIGVQRESNPAPACRRPRVREMCALVEDQRFDHLLPG